MKHDLFGKPPHTFPDHALALRDLPPRRARGASLGIELRRNLVGAFADIEQRLARLLDHGSGLLVKRLGKIADISQLLEQLVRLSIRKTGQEIVDARDGVVEARE